MPLTDVAASLGIPVGTVKSRLHRALGEMRVAAEITPAAAQPAQPGGQLA
jgi:DNA-directed RNA polymerase specialized sigma24 family protein